MGEGISCLAQLGSARLPGELSAVSVVRVTDGAKAHLAAAIPAKRIYVAPDPPAARSVFSRLSSFPGVRAVFLSTATTCSCAGRRIRQRTPWSARRLSGSWRAERRTSQSFARTLFCRNSRAPTWCASSPSALKREARSPPQEAADRLAAAGYSGRDMVSEPGEFGTARRHPRRLHGERSLPHQLF